MEFPQVLALELKSQQRPPGQRWQSSTDLAGSLHIYLHFWVQLSVCFLHRCCQLGGWNQAAASWPSLACSPSGCCRSGVSKACQGETFLLPWSSCWFSVHCTTTLLLVFFLIVLTLLPAGVLLLLNQLQFQGRRAGVCEDHQEAWRWNWLW